MSDSFRKGSLWKLSVDANCIPAGTYTFLGKQGEYLVFGVRDAIQFGLPEQYYRPFLTPCTSRRERTTSTRRFLTSYAHLLSNPPSTSGNIDSMTFCAMTPGVTKKLKGVLRLFTTLGLAAPIH